MRDHRDQDVAIVFPVVGVDKSTEFQRQPPDTSASASNVRSFDTIADRARGGSRHGLSKIVDERLNGVALIQHLCVLVDPTTAALSVNTIPEGESTTTDPDGDLVRVGGSGDQYNRNVTPSQGLLPIAYLQSKIQNYNFGHDPEITIALDDNPSRATLIVAIIAQTKQGASPTTPTVRDSGILTTAYTQAGSTRSCTVILSECILTIWFFYYNNDGGDVMIAIPTDESFVVTLLNYAGALTSPLGQSGGLSNQTSSAGGLMTGSAITPVAQDELIIAAFMSTNSPDSATAGGGFTLRQSHTGGEVLESNIQFYVMDRLGTDNPTAYTPTAQFSAPGAVPFCVAEGTFKD